VATKLAYAPDGGVSFEDYLTAYDDQHAEWVAGTVVPLSPASDKHQDVVGFLHMALRPFVDRAGGVMRAGPSVMRLRGSAREPDLFAVTAEHRARIGTSYLDGAADFVVEVVSPESRARDRVEKFGEYQQAGVREYWLIDPAARTAEQFRLAAGGVFEPVALGTPARLTSEVFPGMWISVEWLWSEPLPEVFDVFRAWGLM
jgi:Uma2 family endonuclease